MTSKPFAAPAAAILLGALLALAGCAPGDVVLTAPEGGYIRNLKGHLDAADWSAAETVTVALSEFSFKPARLEFRRGRAYRLRLENKGERTHTFTSVGFFKAVAVQRLSSAKGELVQPYLRTVAVAPGAAKELFFVAVKPGRYDLECSVFLHATLGMTGRITIL